MRGPFASPSRRLPLPPLPVCLLLAAAAAIFISQCLWLDKVLIDDSFITFSFSKNLAAGNGPLYSHGVRAEGYSNFLWMTLVALPLALARGMDPMSAARLVGVPFLLLLGWGTYRLAALATQSRVAGALAVVVLSCATDLATAYLSGMETAAYAAFYVSSFALLLSSWRYGGNARKRALVPWCALGAALTRIDGFVVVGLVVAFELGRTLIVQRRLAPGALFRWAGPAVLAYLIWFAWRYSYYGLPLPSTYYAKALIPKLLPTRGWQYVRDELASSGLFLAGPSALWLLLRRRAWAVPVLVTVVAQLAYVVKIGGDWMPFGRFVLPVVPLMVILVVGALVEVVRAVPRRLRLVRGVTSMAMVGVALVVIGRVDHRWYNDGAEDTKIALVREQVGHVQRLTRAARFLDAAVPPGRRLVTDYAGVIAYYTDAAVIDMWGLATPIIARRGAVEGVQPIYGRSCAACYLELDPEFFHVMAPLVRHEPAFTSARDVIANVWQTDAIGRYIDFPKVFAVGRVRDDASGDALYFLEKRGPAFSSTPRAAGPFHIDYPFESSPPDHT
jgi:arabinofuranosyltransferase